jgi:hypothetical protein
MAFLEQDPIVLLRLLESYNATTVPKWIDRGDV